MVAGGKGHLGFRVGYSSKTNLNPIHKKTFLNKKPRLVVVVSGP